MNVYEYLKESRVGLILTITNLRMQRMKLKIHLLRQRHHINRIDKQNNRLLNSSACLKDYYEFQQERENKKRISEQKCLK